MAEEMVTVSMVGETLEVHPSCVAAHIDAGWRVTAPRAPAAVEDTIPARFVDGVELTVARGPRGLWYVMQADRRVSRGFETEELALDAATTNQIEA